MVDFMRAGAHQIDGLLMRDIFMSFFELFSQNRRHSWHTFYSVALVVLSGKIIFPCSLRVTTTSFGRQKTF